MKVGDLVKVSSDKNSHFGEIGIVTKRMNSHYVHVMIPSGEFIFSQIALEVIG